MAGLGIQQNEIEMTDAERNEEPQPPTPDPSAETPPTTIPLRATLTKGRSSQFNAGGSMQSPQTPRSKKRTLDEQSGEDHTESDPPATDNPSPIKLDTPRLGRLHQRRVVTSPEKFDRGKFEPLPIRTDLAAAEGPATKRQRTQNVIEIKYDESGQPIIASVTPTLALFPSGTCPGSEQTPKKNFDILEELVLHHQDVLLHVISFLTIPSLISLYAISKRFHFHFNRNLTACVLSSMRTWAPNSDRVFPWRSYQHLILKDPLKRKKESWIGVSDQNPMGHHEDGRDVPSLRWLQMVIWRHGACTDVLIQMAKEGLRCAPGTVDVLKRIWYLLDLPLNCHRVALIHSTKYFDDETLKKATHFFMKLDMFFTDPEAHVYPPNPGGIIPPMPNHLPWVQPGTLPTPAQIMAWQQYNMPPPLHPRAWADTAPIGTDMRELLLGARHLTTLWRVLHGWSPDEARGGLPITRLDVLRLWIKHKYRPQDTPNIPPYTLRQMVIGVPWYDVGSAELERTATSFISTDYHQTHRVATNPLMTSNTEEPKHENQQLLFKMECMLDSERITVPWVKVRETLLRPDELIIKETLRRQMGLHRFWAEMMLHGFCDELGRNYRVMSEEELMNWSRGKKPGKDRVYVENDAPDSLEELDERIKQAADEEREALERGEKVGDEEDERSAMDIV